MITFVNLYVILRMDSDSQFPKTEFITDDIWKALDFLEKKRLDKKGESDSGYYVIDSVRDTQLSSNEVIA
jgi:hypothetical protein